MFKIRDGREYFYQWDLDRELIVNDSTIKEVHYCNRTDDCSLVVEVKNGIAPVPNQILQHSFDVRVFAYDGSATLHEQVFKVKPRTKPSDYVYTETEVKSYEYLDAKLTEIERQGFSEETVSKAVNNYLSDSDLVDKEYVDTAVANAKVDLTGYATEKYVDEAIDAIPVPNVSAQINVHNTSSTAHSDIRKAIPTKVSQLANDKGYITEVPKVDLSDYAKKTYVDTAISNIPETDLSSYATKKYVDTSISNIDFPETDLTGYATEAYVINKVNEAALGGEGGAVDLSIYATKQDIEDAFKDIDVDLTGYATEQYVNEQIEAIPEVDLSGYAKKTDIPDVSEFITAEDIPEVDLSGYAKIEDIPDTSTFISAIPEEYVTETELAAKGYATLSHLNDYATTQALELEAQSRIKVNTKVDELAQTVTNDYALKTEIPVVPTKVSAFENDKGYLTEHQSLEGYATEQFVTNAIDAIPEPDLTPYATKTELTSNVNTLNGSITAINTELDATNSEVATVKASIPTKVSQLTNDKNYLTAVPSEYVTESELLAKKYATTTQLNNEVKALEGDIADVESTVTRLNNTVADVNTAVTNMSTTKADKSYVDNHVTSITSTLNNLSTTKANKSYVDAEITEVEKSITNLGAIKADITYVDQKVAAHREDVDDAVDTLTESVNTLTESVNTLSSTKADKTYVDTAITALSEDIDNNYYTKDEIEENYYDKEEIHFGMDVTVGRLLYQHNIVVERHRTFKDDGSDYLLETLYTCPLIINDGDAFTFSDLVKYIWNSGGTLLVHGDDTSTNYAGTEAVSAVFTNYSHLSVDSAYSSALNVHYSYLQTSDDDADSAYTPSAKTDFSVWQQSSTDDMSTWYVTVKDTVYSLGYTLAAADLDDYYTKDEVNELLEDIPTGGGGTGTDVSNLYEHRIAISNYIFATVLSTKSTPYTETTLADYIAQTGNVPCSGVISGDPPTYWRYIKLTDADNPSDGLTVVGACNYQTTSIAIVAETLVDTVVKVGGVAVEGGGSVDVDLSDYYTKSQTDAAIQEAIDNIEIPEGGGVSGGSKLYRHIVTVDKTQFEIIDTRKDAHTFSSVVEYIYANGGSVPISYTTYSGNVIYVYTKATVSSATATSISISGARFTHDNSNMTGTGASTSSTIASTVTVTDSVTAIGTAAVNGGSGEVNVDLSNYYTKSEVDALIPDTSSFLTAVPNEYVTETELSGKGYLTEHQSLEGYAKTSDIPDVSAFQTEAQVLALIQANMPASGDEVSY